MRYTVLVRQRPPGKYIARAPAVPGCKGEGRTRDEALRRLRTAIETWLAEAEITTIEVALPQTDKQQELNPWLATAGIFADDPMLEPMLKDIYAARAKEQAME